MPHPPHPTGTAAIAAVIAPKRWFGRISALPADVARVALAERDRWFLWMPVLLAVGIVLYFSLRFEPPLWSGPLAVGAALIILITASALPPHRRIAVRLAACAAGLVALGFAAAQVQTARSGRTPLTKAVGPITLEGRVHAIEPFPQGARIVLTGVTGQARGASLPERVRIRLRGSDPPPIAPGDIIRVPAMLSPPPAPVIPGGYDFQREAFFAGLGAVGYSVGAAKVVAPAADRPARVETWFGALRHAVAEEVRAAVPPPTSGVITALIVGEKRAVPEPTMAAIRDSGLAHLLAISGLHIGLVAMLVMLALRSAFALIPWVALRYPTKKWAAGGAALAAGFYTLLAGAPVPSQRAFLMVLLVLLAVVLDRRTTPMRLVAIAAAAVCLTQPVSVLGPSFQMSFFAVIALIAVYEATVANRRFATARAERWRPLVYLGGVALTSLIATLATAPFVIFHFNRLAIFGLVANLIAVPLTTLWIMPWAILALALMPFGLTALALTPMGWGVDLVIWVAQEVADWPGAVAQLPPMPAWALGLAAFGLLWLTLWRQRWRWFGLAPLMAAAAATLAMRPPDLLIDGRGKLIAVRAGDGSLLLSSARASAMARDAWLRAGERAETVATFPPPGGASADARLRCDGVGCVWRSDHHLVAIARFGDALSEDCRRADVLISLVPVRAPCPAPAAIVDRFALWREGAHAVWLNAEGVRIASVNGLRGDRPWVLRPPASTTSRSTAGAPTEAVGETPPDHAADDDDDPED